MWLLVVGSIPVLLVGLARDYTSFLLFRLAIGVVGASFVVTQFHMSLMFGAKVRGTAGAIVGGWGNLGGGATAWRLAMVVPAVMMWVVAFLYYRYTSDTPAGNSRDLSGSPGVGGLRGWLSAAGDRRVLALTLAYAASFGMEITFNNAAALFFADNYGLSGRQAGLYVGVFGSLNLFARALGGICSDKAGARWGMRGKGILLGAALLFEGLALIAFAHAGGLAAAVFLMLLTGLFLKMANGAVFGIVPFINGRHVGSVSGLVGAEKVPGQS